MDFYIYYKYTTRIKFVHKTFIFHNTSTQFLQKKFKQHICVPMCLK